MAEYIEREKAFKLIKEQKEKETGAYSKGRNKGLTIAGSIINNKEALSTADVVEVKHGKWIIENSERDWKDKDTYILSIKCSECGKVHFLGTTKYQNEYDKEKLKKLGNYGDYSFCGKCGAKMDLVGD